MAVTVGGKTLLARTVNAALTWADQVVVAAPEPRDWTPNPRVTFALEDPPFGGPVAGIKAALQTMGSSGEVLVLAGDLANPDEVVAALTDSGVDEGDAAGARQRGTSSAGEGDAAGARQRGPLGAGEGDTLVAGEGDALDVGEGDASGVSRRDALDVGESDVFGGADALVLEDTEGWPQYLAGRYKLAPLRRAADERAGANMSVRNLMKGLRLRRIGAPREVTADLDTPEDLLGTLGLTHP